MHPDSPRLDYRSTRDAAGDDARAMRRSVRTWVLLTGVWAVGLGVWVVYLAMIGLLFLRFLA
jgi:hypothetical protein